MKNPMTPTGIEPATATFGFVAQHLNHNSKYYSINFIKKKAVILKGLHYVTLRYVTLRYLLH